MDFVFVLLVIAAIGCLGFVAYGFGAFSFAQRRATPTTRAARTAAEPMAKPTRPPSKTSIPRAIGGALFFLGILSLDSALREPTDIATDQGPVANFDLMHAQSMHIGIAAMWLVVGVLLMLFSKSPAERAKSESKSLASPLEQLADLRSRGILTDAEYLAKCDDLQRQKVSA